MRVIIKKAEPVPTPPNTVDIIGLTEREAGVLKGLIGRAGGGELQNLYNALTNVNQVGDWFTGYGSVRFRG